MFCRLVGWYSSCLADQALEPNHLTNMFDWHRDIVHLYPFQTTIRAENGDGPGSSEDILLNIQPPWSAPASCMGDTHFSGWATIMCMSNMALGTLLRRHLTTGWPNVMLGTN